MTRRAADCLVDILEAIARVRRHRSHAGLVPEDLLRDAVIYQLVVVGEAVKGVDMATRAQRTDVDWKKIAGLRDLLTHEYFRIDHGRIDDITDQELGDLESAARALLGTNS